MLINNWPARTFWNGCNSLFRISEWSNGRVLIELSKNAFSSSKAILIWSSNDQLYRLTDWNSQDPSALPCRGNHHLHIASASAQSTRRLSHRITRQAAHGSGERRAGHLPCCVVAATRATTSQDCRAPLRVSPPRHTFTRVSRARSKCLI